VCLIVSESKLHSNTAHQLKDKQQPNVAVGRLWPLFRIRVVQMYIRRQAILTEVSFSQCIQANAVIRFETTTAYFSYLFQIRYCLTILLFDPFYAPNVSY
jgi:hypothetical protein